MKNLCIFLT